MTIVEQDVEASGFDGARLSARLVMREGVHPRAPSHDHSPPLVCLPGHLRPARTMLPLARALLERPNGPDRVLLVDYRGRGRSEPRDDAARYTPTLEGQDLISLLDAMNWHSVDVVASAHGGLVVLSTVGTRPALVRRLVLGDIGPELDGVGLARLRTAAARHSQPRTWDEAVGVLRGQLGQRFPALSDDDWEDWARHTWRDSDGRPASDVHPHVFEHFAAIDADRRYPTLWREFGALARTPILLLRAEHSDMLGERTVERMRREHPRLTVETVDGQGHPPLLHLAALPERIAAFLSD